VFPTTLTPSLSLQRERVFPTTLTPSISLQRERVFSLYSLPLSRGRARERV